MRASRPAAPALPLQSGDDVVDGLVGAGDAEGPDLQVGGAGGQRDGRFLGQVGDDVADLVVDRRGGFVLGGPGFGVGDVLADGAELGLRFGGVGDLEVVVDLAVLDAVGLLDGDVGGLDAVQMAMELTPMTWLVSGS